MDSQKVYLVESADDDTVMLALDPAYDEGYMRWYDTTRERMFAGQLLSQAKDRAEFVSESGTFYSFSPLTLAAYRDRVQPSVVGSPHFSSEAELYRYYRENF